MAAARSANVDFVARVGEIFESQQSTALSLRASTATRRTAKISKLRDVVLENVDALYTASEADFQKPRMEIDVSEIALVVAEANEAIRNVRRWMRPEKVWPSRAVLGTKGYIQHQPRGRCLIISPWNYPLSLTFGPLVSAVAAGNTAIIKPSEMTPHVSALMGRMIREVFDENEVALIEGDASAAIVLLDLPFDHIFFTGSSAVGKVVMAAAAKHLASVTLELGGKSPTIVDETADIDGAVRNIMWSKFINSGQTCIAPDHVYVHTAVKEKFVARARDVLADSYGADATEWPRSPNLARMVNSEHTARVKALLADAKQRGATVLIGGEASVEECYVTPTLLADIPRDAKIMSEEIFGPLLPIISFASLAEVISGINGSPKPLALYVWSRRDETIQKVIQETSSGGVCINSTMVQFSHQNLPFGGINSSGIGSAHGHYGFRAFSHQRAVVRNQFALNSLLYPPYTDRMRAIARLLIKMS